MSIANKLGIYGFVFGYLGTIITRVFLPSFWWVGMILGVTIGCLVYEPAQVKSAAIEAWRPVYRRTIYFLGNLASDLRVNLGTRFFQWYCTLIFMLDVIVFFWIAGYVDSKLQLLPYQPSFANIPINLVYLFTFIIAIAGCFSGVLVFYESWRDKELNSWLAIAGVSISLIFSIVAIGMVLIMMGWFTLILGWFLLTVLDEIVGQRLSKFVLLISTQERLLLAGAISTGITFGHMLDSNALVGGLVAGLIGKLYHKFLTPRVVRALAR